jgi:hypothetical protein
MWGDVTMLGWSRSPVRCAAFVLFLLSSATIIGQSSRVEATATVPPVIKTLRAVVVYNGIPGSVQTPLYGGQGMTITDLNGGSQMRIDFPSGTWINPKTAKLCYFVPMVNNYYSGTPSTSIFSLVENSDGSGTVEVETGTVATVDKWGITAVSADC